MTARVLHQRRTNGASVRQCRREAPRRERGWSQILANQRRAAVQRLPILAERPRDRRALRARAARRVRRANLRLRDKRVDLVDCDGRIAIVLVLADGQERGRDEMAHRVVEESILLDRLGAARPPISVETGEKVDVDLAILLELIAQRGEGAEGGRLPAAESAKNRKISMKR